MHGTVIPILTKIYCVLARHSKRDRPARPTCTTDIQVGLLLLYATHSQMTQTVCNLWQKHGLFYIQQLPY